MHVHARLALGEYVWRASVERRVGIALTLLTTLGFGVEYWLLARMIAPSLGGVTSVWAIRAFGVLSLPPMLLLAHPIRREEHAPARRSLALPTPGALPLILLVGVFDTGSFCASALAIPSPR
jgi:hypothetical protein